MSFRFVLVVFLFFSINVGGERAFSGGENSNVGNGDAWYLIAFKHMKNTESF